MNRSESYLITGSIIAGSFRFGDQEEQPGADLNAAWYRRNLKIFAKLTQIAKPGDRMLVVFGAGHSFWLRHFVQNTPGFELVEPNHYCANPPISVWRVPRWRWRTFGKWTILPNGNTNWICNLGRHAQERPGQDETGQRRL